MPVSTVSIFCKVNNKVKRTSLMCVFFAVSACSDNAKIPESNPPEETLQQAPLLSLSELLAADDVRQALAEASKTKDGVALKEWQTRLLSAADEVFLMPSERQLISGKQGLMFLEFQGMKVNYQAAFDEAFFNFENVDAVFEAYPAFESLHKKGRDLVIRRDKLILQTTAKLEKDGFNGDAKSEAKRQWQAVVSQHHPQS